MKTRLAPLPIHNLGDADRRVPGIDMSEEYYYGVMKADLPFTIRLFDV